MSNNPNPTTDVTYRITIEASDVEDREWQAKQVKYLVEQLDKMLPSNCRCWIDEVKCEEIKQP